MMNAPDRLEIPKELEPYREVIEKKMEGLPEWKVRDRIMALRASSYKLAKHIYSTPTGEKIVELPGRGKMPARYMIMRNGSWRKIRISP
jgi:hypothetical protein